MCNNGKSEKNNRLSIVVRTKNRPLLLKEAIESVLGAYSELHPEKQGQILSRATSMDQGKGRDDRVEIVIVNDGGDSVKSLVQELLTGKMKFQYIDVVPGIGRSAAGNKGVELAQNPWIFFLDDDDLLMKEAIRRFFDHLSATGIEEKRGSGKPVVYHGKVKAMRFKGESTGEPLRVFASPFNSKAILWENHIPINALIIPKGLFLEVGGFDIELTCFEDWDLLLRLADRATLTLLNFFTAVYRVFDHSFIVGGGGEQWQSGGRKAVYRKHWHRYTPDTLLEIYNAVNKEMRGAFLPEMTVLKENLADLEAERFHWSIMDKNRLEYIHELESIDKKRNAYLQKLETDIQKLEKESKDSREQWQRMDNERTDYIRNLEKDLLAVERTAQNQRLEWEKMDRERTDYARHLEKDLSTVEQAARARQLEWEQMDKERKVYVKRLLRQIEELEQAMDSSIEKTDV